MSIWSSLHHLVHLNLLATLLLGGLLNLTALAEPLTRADVQSFFKQCDGNGGRSAAWHNHYIGQWVAWEGEVFKTRYREASYREEVYIKVLPESLFYDTVVILEGGTRLDPAIAPGRQVQFRGQIFNGIDTMGIKHVGVKLKTPLDIQVI